MTLDEALDRCSPDEGGWRSARASEERDYFYTAKKSPEGRITYMNTAVDGSGTDTFMFWSAPENFDWEPMRLLP